MEEQHLSQSNFHWLKNTVNFTLLGIMSLTEESIYNLIPVKPQYEEQPVRYKSVFHNTVREQYKDKKFAFRTMGAVNYQTTEYLKKKEETPNTNANTFQRKTPIDGHKPRVPKASEKPVMNLKSKKDFVKANALFVIKSPAKKPTPRYVDAADGTTRDLEPSGLHPKFIAKSDFGKVPQYLEQRKVAQLRDEEAYKEYIQQRFQRGALQQISAEEHADTLEKLKENWEELYIQYQGLSVTTDTTPKKLRKEKIESDLKQLERDIEALEKHSVLYVTDNF